MTAPLRDGVRAIALDNPPVNALSFAYCAALLEVLGEAERDPGVRAVVLYGANGFFSAGADVNDFNTEPQAETKTVRDLVAAIASSRKRFVAAIDGTCLGGGLEVALACDECIASPRAKLGFPEIKLGLIPGAGGTQRLPRLIGARDALELMLKGSACTAHRAKELGMLDRIVEGDLVEAAIASAVRVCEKRALRERAGIGANVPPQAKAFVLAQTHRGLPPEERGGLAAHTLVEAVQASVELPLAFGVAREARLFGQLVRSAPSLALRHLFFAERELSKIPDLPQAEPLPVAAAAVVGAGTMGTGIAIAFAQAGIPVVVFDPSDDAVAKARETVMGTFMYHVRKGRLTQEEAWNRGQSIRFAEDWSELAGADVVVEAVFEDLAAKNEVFVKLDAIAKPEAILATNTSTLDVDAMAAATGRPGNVLGLHFFVPANVMPLLEVVRGAQTSPQALATAFALGKRLRKKAVLSRNAFGFIGNRMTFDYVRAALALAEEGTPVARIDAVMKDFGFAMGPFAMSDLSGLDVALSIVQARGRQAEGRTNVIARLVEMRRLGQKTLAGYFKYDSKVGNGREPIADPEVDALFTEEARTAGVPPRAASDAEIRERLLGALIDRGEHLLEAGVALRPGDIDIVYVYGYGFPPYRGGPMWYARA